MARLHSNLSRIASACPQAASAALLQTGADILKLAQQLVPKDTTSLEKSGGVMPISSTVAHVGFGSPGQFFTKAGESTPREPAKYAHYVEYGTVHSPSQPFLVPAFMQSQKTFHTRLMQEMKKINGVD